MTKVRIQLEETKTNTILMKEMEIGEYAVMQNEGYEGTLILKGDHGTYISLNDPNNIWDEESANYHDVKLVSEVNITYTI